MSRFEVNGNKIKDNIEDKEYEIDDFVDVANDLFDQQEIISQKINEILDVDKIYYYNYTIGLAEILESVCMEINDLIKNPKEFTLTPHDAEDCINYKGGKCEILNKELDRFENCDCEEFQWKVF